MSEGATTGIDPRFDPRYQRGYTGHGVSEAATGADAASAPLPAVSRVPEPPESMRSLIAPKRDRAAAADRTAEPHSGWISDPVPPVRERTDGAFVAAWVVSAATLFIGAGLFWSGISGGSFYGPSTAADQWLQTVSWLVAPALVQAGLLGLVGMLVWTGIRRARGDASRSVAAAGDAAEVDGRR